MSSQENMLAPTNDFFPLFDVHEMPFKNLPRTGSYHWKNQLSSPSPKLEQCVPIDSALASLPGSRVSGNLPLTFSYINSIGIPAGIGPGLET